MGCYCTNGYSNVYRRKDTRRKKVWEQLGYSQGYGKTVGWTDQRSKKSQVILEEIRTVELIDNINKTLALDLAEMGIPIDFIEISRGRTNGFVRVR